MTDVASRQYGFYSTTPRPERGLCAFCGDAEALTERGLCGHCDSFLYTPIGETVKSVARPARPGRRRKYDAEAMYADYQAGMTISQVAAKWGTRSCTVYHYFRRAGLPLRSRRDINRAAGMYFDYCTGMSTAEVADKWGLTRAYVATQIKALGVPMRPRKGGVKQAPVPSCGFDEANSIRAEIAGKRRAEAARKALQTTVLPLHRQVLELRIEHPTRPLRELGRLCDPPMTKDMYASHLRRALENAGTGQ